MDYLVMVEDYLHGPTVLWGQLKGKKVNSNDGKDLGDMIKYLKTILGLKKEQ